MSLTIHTTIDGKTLSETDRLLAELERSRVALALLKKHIGAEQMQEILKAPLAESEQMYKKWLAQYQGGHQVSQTRLQIEDMTAEEFVNWYHHAPQDALLAANPEHYILRAEGDKLHVCETVGHYGLPLDFSLRFTQDESILPIALDAGYDSRFNMIGDGFFYGEDDALPIYVAHQFRNTENGFEALLQIIFPDSVPAELVENHKTHLAIEFGNWVQMAYRAVKGE